MKQQEVFRKTGAIIKELLDQYEYLQETQDDLNDLELELFVANTHFLKDHAEILRKLNLQRSQETKALPPAAEDRTISPQPASVQQEEPAAPLPAIPLPPVPEPVVNQAPKQEPVAQPQTEQPATRFNLPKPDFFRPQPKVEIPRLEVPAPEIKRPTGEPKYFEPVVQPVKPAERAPFVAPQAVEPEPAKQETAEDTPVPSINLDAGRDADTYSFQREEAGTVKHTLEINETDTFTEDLTEPEQRITLADELAATDTLYSETQQADETEQPNIVPTNPEPVIDNTPKTAAEQAPETLKSAQPVAVQAPAQNQPIAAAMEEPQRPLTLNERLRAQQQGNNITVPSQQKQEAPISDLKSAISLNDKLLFVKDLFNGYSLAYSEAIEIVNRFSSFEEADRFLKTNYVTKNNWDDKKATSDKFYALLKRRYA